VTCDKDFKQFATQRMRRGDIYKEAP